ncbi:MAG: ribosome-assembly protein 3-domain-containing protein [Benjaminiella poitrasii]|nr:MAG: ribosome-assembly protein 3-domain-containing protein [Benjaminiella poitrasii]
MANSAGKKRSSTTKLQQKPSKVWKKEENVTEEFEDNKVKQDEGLFDNLDEEMDQDELDDLVNQLKEESDLEEGMEENESNEEHIDSESSETKEVKDEQQEEIPDVVEEQSTSSKFRNLYMNKITQAFGSDLDQIRQEPSFNGPRLNILIDSLEAGIDIFSNLEQEIILADEEK